MKKDSHNLFKLLETIQEETIDPTEEEFGGCEREGFDGGFLE